MMPMFLASATGRMVVSFIEWGELGSLEKSVWSARCL